MSICTWLSHSFVGHRKMKRLFFFIVFVFSGHAYSQALPSYSGGASGGTLVPGGLSSIGGDYRTIASNTNVAGETLLADKVRVGVGAANADMYANRAISLRNAMAMGARALPLIGTAALAYSLYDSLGCHWSSSSGLQCDMGAAPLSSPGYRYQSAANQSSPFYDTQAEVIVGSLTNGATLVSYSCPVIPQGSQATCTFKYRHINGTVYDAAIGVAYLSTTVKTCPGGVKVRPDQMCNGGSIQTLTPEAAADKVLPYASPASALDIVKQALQNGVNAAPYVSVRPATGPAILTQPATTKTVTAANGTSQVQTSQVTNNITYAGDTYNIMNTTNITNPDGSSEKVQETPKKDLCEQYPSSVGCMNVGDLPSDSPTWQTKTVTYQAESLGFTGSCPAPWSGSVHGWNLSMSWQPACDVAPQIRLGVLALCTLGALLMISTTVRT